MNRAERRRTDKTIRKHRNEVPMLLCETIVVSRSDGLSVEIPVRVYAQASDLEKATTLGVARDDPRRVCVLWQKSIKALLVHLRGPIVERLRECGYPPLLANGTTGVEKEVLLPQRPERQYSATVTWTFLHEPGAPEEQPVVLLLPDALAPRLACGMCEVCAPDPAERAERVAAYTKIMAAMRNSRMQIAGAGAEPAAEITEPHTDVPTIPAPPPDPREPDATETPLDDPAVAETIGAEPEPGT